MTSGSTFPYTYSTTPLPTASRSIRFSRTELIQIAGAFAILTLDFVLIFSGAGLLEGGQIGSAFSSLTLVVVAALTALTAFVLHEVAHKIAAQRLGCWAEFRWSLSGLAFSVFTAYLGFLFAAPGATVVSGMADTREWGKTALAGPMMNLGMGAAFYAGALFTWYRGDSVFVWFLALAFYNSWFGTFNLFPFGPLDGAKVLRWSTAVWIVAIIGTGALAAVSYVALNQFGNPVLQP
jgi:Zn-dependent protease